MTNTYLRPARYIKLSVPVTPEDIAQGTPGMSGECPIALAVNRKVDQLHKNGNPFLYYLRLELEHKFTTITAQHSSFYVDYNHPQYRNLRFCFAWSELNSPTDIIEQEKDGITEDYRKRARIAMRDFVDKFDEKKPVEPITLNLPIQVTVLGFYLKFEQMEEVLAQLGGKTF